MSIRTMSQQKLSTQVYNKTKPLLVFKGSVYFDGSGDYLSVASNTALNMSSGDFTLEFWWKPTSLSGFQTPFDKGFTDAGGLLMQTSSNGKITVYAPSSAFTSSTAITANAWTHIALVRNSGTLKMYQGGTQVGSASNSTDFTNTGTLYIGTDRSLSSSSQFPGYISNFRLVKGTAVYTSAFTPPTTPLTPIAGTSLLTCTNPNTIADYSANSFTVTVAGNAVASSDSPFS